MRKDVLYRQLENKPGLRALMKDGAIYENVKSPASWTLPSHVSIFTGMYPSEHGVHYYCNRSDSDILMASKLSEYSQKENVLARQMRKRGYHTISLSANILVSGGAGMENGFDICEAVGPWATIDRATKAIVNGAGTSGVSENGDLMSQIRQNPLGSIKMAKAFASAKFDLIRNDFPVNKGGQEIMSRFETLGSKEPFFVFMNLMEAHEPYLPFHSPFSLQPDSFREQLRDLSRVKEIRAGKIDRIKRRYNNEVNKIDDVLERLIRHLKSIDAYDDTLIVITSDHGQSLKEKGFYGHGMFLHEEITDVPLIIKFPGDHSKMTTNEYRSILGLKAFVEGWGEGQKTDLASMPFVYAESYGVPERMVKGNLSRDTDFEDNVLRKCVWQDGYKLTVDGTNGKVESLERKGIEVDVRDNRQVVDSLTSNLEIFVGNQDFVMP